MKKLSGLLELPTNDGLPEISKMKYRNRIPETTISGFADSKKKIIKN
jgi:hypothetical protein